MALNCPSCDEAAAEYVAMADDGRNAMRCGVCGHDWLQGPRPVSPRAVSERGRTPRRPVRNGTRELPFPTLADVDPAALRRVAALDARYRAAHHRPDDRVPEYRERYRAVFSAEGLPHAEPQMLKDFANSTVIAHPGNMSVFNRTVPILTYSSGSVGKREIGRAVLGVDMPAPGQTSHSRGRLAHWSNDLIVDGLAAAGMHVADRDYVGGFLWWAKDQE